MCCSEDGVVRRQLDISFAGAALYLTFVIYFSCGKNTAELLAVSIRIEELAFLNAACFLMLYDAVFAHSVTTIPARLQGTF